VLGQLPQSGIARRRAHDFSEEYLHIFREVNNAKRAEMDQCPDPRYANSIYATSILRLNQRPSPATQADSASTPEKYLRIPDDVLPLLPECFTINDEVSIVAAQFRQEFPDSWMKFFCGKRPRGKQKDHCISEQSMSRPFSDLCAKELHVCGLQLLIKSVPELLFLRLLQLVIFVLKVHCDCFEFRDAAFIQCVSQERILVHVSTNLSYTVDIGDTYAVFEIGVKARGREVCRRDKSELLVGNVYLRVQAREIDYLTICQS